MGHLQDFWEVIRALALPWLHRWLSLLGAYAEGDVAPSSYALTAELGEEVLERRLHEAGFVRNPVAAFKHRGDVHESGSWVWRQSLLADRQVHVVLFPGFSPDETDIYAHQELSWITHPLTHYSQRGIDMAAGVSHTRTLFCEHAISFHVRDVESDPESSA